MPYNIQGADDEIAFDGNVSFRGGVNSVSRPSMLNEDEVSDLVNMVIDPVGRVVTRAGCTYPTNTPGNNVVRGMQYFDTSTSEFLMVSANGALYAWDGALRQTVSGFSSGGGVNISMAQFGGKLYVTNGTNVYEWDGNISNAASTVANTPACSLMCAHAGRMFYLTGTDTILPSNLNNPATTGWLSFRIGQGEGSEIVGWQPWHNNILVVLKRNSIYMLDASPVNPTGAVVTSSAEFPIELISPGIGCVAGKSIASVGNDVYFLSDDGVRSVARTQSEKQVGTSPPLSTPIQPLIDRINWAYANTACATHHNNRYMLAVPLDSATSPNCLLVMNVLTGKWEGCWTGWQPVEFCETFFAGRRKLHFGGIDGKVGEFLDWKPETAMSDTDYTDSGTPIQSSLTTRSYTHGSMLHLKTGFGLVVDFSRSLALASIDILQDEGAPQRLWSGATSLGSVRLPVFLPFMLPKSGPRRVLSDMLSNGQHREVQLRISSTGGKLAVASSGVEAFVDSIENH